MSHRTDPKDVFVGNLVFKRRLDEMRLVLPESFLCSVTSAQLEYLDSQEGG